MKRKHILDAINICATYFDVIYSLKSDLLPTKPESVEADERILKLGPPAGPPSISSSHQKHVRI